MKPMKIKDLLSAYGEIGRVFLAPEDPKSYARRVRFGGNKKRNFEEGWVEFKNKKRAKLVAETLNTQIIGIFQKSPYELHRLTSCIIGGKKGSYYHDDIWNIKYLPKFKWHHLQSQISLENAARQSKMRTEIAHETRVNKTYLKNVERAKMLENMEAKKRKRKGQDDMHADQKKIRRKFRQNKPIEAGQPKQNGSEVDEENYKVKKLLSKVF